MNAPHSARALRLGRIWIIAAREFRQTVLTKSFLIAALLLPALMIGAGTVIPLLTGGAAPPVVGTLLVADSDGSVAQQMNKAFDALRAAAAAGGSAANAAGGTMAALDPDLPRGPWTEELRVDIRVERLPLEGDLAAAQARVQDGEALGLVTVPTELLRPVPPPDIDLTVLVPSSSPAKTTAIIERISRDATVTARVEASGGDVSAVRALLRQPGASTSRMSRDGMRAPERLVIRMVLPGAFMFLMWIAAFTSANHLLTSTIEEKSSKVIEVLLSAASPLELLAGKIVGQGLVSLVLLGLYGIAGLVGLTMLAVTDILPVGTILLFLAWFLLSYFMSAALMAAVGSAVSDLREAQTLVSPVMMVMMAPLMLWLPISENPTGMLATVTSFLPPIGPFVMVLRTTAALEPIPQWQVAAALIVNAAATVGFVWLAARIFRVGILMQGKPPTPLELLRWARVR